MKGGDFDGKKTSGVNHKIDYLFSKTNEHRLRVGSAQQTIKQALSRMDNPYVAFSGGKDSTVLLHLVLQQKPNINVMYIDQGMEYPDTYDYIRQMWKEWHLKLSWEKPYKDLWELYDEGGFLNPDKQTCTKVKKTFSNTVFFDPIRRYNKRTNADGFFMGLRKEESNIRKKSLERTGEIYLRANGQISCCPLAEWTARDIWAHITANNIPYNKVYDKTRFEERNNIRVAPFGIGGTHILHGSYVTMKYYYPSLWNKFCEKNPLVRKYI